MLIHILLYFRARFFLQKEFKLNLDDRALFNATFSMQLEAITFAFSMLGNAFILRIPAFFFELSQSQKSQVSTLCFKQFTLSILVVVSILFSPILLINVSRFGTVYRKLNQYTPQEVLGIAAPKLSAAMEEFQFGEFFPIQEIKAIVEIPAFYIVILLILFFPYKIPNFFSQLYQLDADLRLKFCLQTLKEIIIDIPLIMMALVLLLAFRRWSSFYNYYKKRERSQLGRITTEQFVAFLLDVPALICSLVILLSWYQLTEAFSHVKNIWKKEESDSRPFDFHIVIFKVTWNILLDLICIICSFLVLIFIYRVKHMLECLANRHAHHTWRSIVFKEAREQIYDIPFIIISFLTLWRLQYLIYSILFHYSSAIERRKACVYHAKQALLDIPFVISILLMIVSVLHILSLFILYREYKSSIQMIRKRSLRSDNDESKTEEPISTEEQVTNRCRISCIKTALPIPLQLPILLCAYFVIFSVYRVPISIRMIKNSMITKKKIMAKIIIIQASCIILDIISLLISSIVMITICRAPYLLNTIKTEIWFIESFNFKEAIAIHRKALLVFFDLIKDIPLIILVVFSSFAVWRIGYIR